MQVEQLKLVPAGIGSLNTKNSSAASNDKTFGEFLADALDETNKLQHEASTASSNLATGQVEDVSEVVIAAKKATVALQLTMQVRNKIVEAYQEIMRMQV
jgi:flagellar hook-basal body complex protein FliE